MEFSQNWRGMIVGYADYISYSTMYDYEKCSDYFHPIKSPVYWGFFLRHNVDPRPHIPKFSLIASSDILHTIPYVPKKITIGLSAWITLKVVSESKNNFKLWKYDYFSTFQWRPHLIWSSNHKEIWIFVKQVTGPFVPSFAIRMYMAFTDTLRSQHTDLQTFQILCIPFQQRLILTTF